MFADLKEDVKTIRPIAEGILDDTQRLLRQEVALAKSEMRQELAVAKEAGLLIAAGFSLASLVLLLSSFTLVYLVSWGIPSLPLFADFGIVTIALALPASALLMSARKTIQSTRFLPYRTLETLKETASTIAGGNL